MERQATVVADGREPGLLSPCVCSTLRMVSRAVTQLHDDILRQSGLRVTSPSRSAGCGRSECGNPYERKLRVSADVLNSESIRRA